MTPDGQNAHPLDNAAIRERNQALVCFEATGGQEWRLWSALDAAGIATRQLPPAQIKAFAASRGTRAKTDRIDAELIARFMAFRPDAGRRLPHEKIRLLRALISKRGQLVEIRKRLLAQIKAHGKLGSADMFEAMDAEVKGLLDRQIAELETQIDHIITTDESLARTAVVLRSVPGIGPVASTMLIAEMPELGQITGEQAAALTGLAPIAHEQRSDARQARNWRWSAIATACDVPGGARSQSSQSSPEIIRRSLAHSRKTTQGCHHSCVFTSSSSKRPNAQLRASWAYNGYLSKHRFFEFSNAATGF